MSKLITESELQSKFYYSLCQRYQMVCPNIFMGMYEMDIFALRKSGFLDEIEIKLSVADYKADFKKRANRFLSKHEAIASGKRCCNYFSFLIPENIESKIDVPDYAGLYVYRPVNGKACIVEMKKAKLLHKNKISDQSIIKVGKKMAYRYWN